MADTLVNILPYTIGLIVSPLPVVALILLLVGDGGTKKGTLFEILWLATSYLATLLIMVLLESFATLENDGQKPSWQFVVSVIMGVVLLFLALLTRTRIFRKKHDIKVRKPAWMKVLDHFNMLEVALITVALVIANPVNLSMILAASIELANMGTTLEDAVAPVAIFVLIGSLSVLVPYFLVLFAGKRAHNFLHSVRHWLMLYGDRLSFWAAFGFGVFFLFKGLEGLL